MLRCYTRMGGIILLVRGLAQHAIKLAQWVVGWPNTPFACKNYYMKLKKK